ncbi:MAG TPA: AmmeMemoRadiSam system protein B [Verrucomicrobiae bacterium]|nr:AmmeMemoRadiSam system protein B [Verrucomicrobiae bacterium]
MNKPRDREQIAFAGTFRRAFCLAAIVTTLLARASWAGVADPGTNTATTRIQNLAPSTTSPTGSAVRLTSVPVIREPAVAGLFYPRDSTQLSQTVDALLAAAKSHTIEGELHAIVCPHAGYEFSGPVAAEAYRLVKGRAYDTVVILAPSHYALFRGASVIAADAYRTPLGVVRVLPRAREWAKTEPFVLEPRCLVERPGWSKQASHPEPAFGEDTPETWEHAAEVEVPFLQKTLTRFSLVSIITGEVDPAKLAEALAKYLDEKTLLVVSTDLSHYYPYDVAREKDARCVSAICDLDPARMQNEEACGKTGVLTLLHLARLKGWKATLLDARNSGDTSGQKERVVGYAAIAFCSPPPQVFSGEEREQLLRLARRSLTEVVTNDRLPEVTTNAFPQKFVDPKGCFVTLTEHGRLRGCIGHIYPQESLYKAVMDNSLNAATRDTRFLPVRPDELGKINIEISVLTVPEPLAFSSPDDLLTKLQPNRDGVVLRMGSLGATYLPQVWEQIPDKTQFLDTLAEKAGAAPGDWRAPGTQVFIYHVESFKESEK